MTAIDTAPLDKLKRDVRATATYLGRDEIRALVDLYYRSQEHRIALGNQAIALGKAEKPTDLLDHFHGQLHTIEKQVVSALDAWSSSDPSAAWAKAQVGIGPVLASGLAAHIDITRAPTAGAIWRFFGLDPTVVWGKGQKRPWNADAKVLAWKIGDSFVKVSGNPNAFYGHKYRERKQYEVDRDVSGGNAATAAQTLLDRNIVDPDLKKKYESGHLPDGRLDLRARRWAVKLFLAHFHEVAYRNHYGTEAPLPYPITQLGHVHHIPAPPG